MSKIGFPLSTFWGCLRGSGCSTDMVYVWVDENWPKVILRLELLLRKPAVNVASEMGHIMGINNLCVPLGCVFPNLMIKTYAAI